jgi:uncharacterized protein (TIGR03067 family)
MRSIVLLTCVLGVWCLVAPASADDKSGPDKLQGTWKLDKVHWSEKNSKSYLKLSSKYEMTVKGNEMIVKAEGQGGKIKETTYTFTLDEKKTPRVYRRKQTKGDDKDKTESGIYEIDGDNLKLCFRDKGGLPKDFSIQQGVDVKNKYLYEFKRSKP